MGASAEFITGTVFASVMVVIGLGAIWIVRWQTYFLLRNQRHDLEHGQAPREAHSSDAESIELDDLAHPPTNCSESSDNDGHEFDHSGSTSGDSHWTVGTPSTNPAYSKHLPGTSILEDHRSPRKGRAAFPSNTSGCNSARDHDVGVDSTSDKQLGMTDDSMLSGTTLLDEADKVDQRIEE